MKAKAQHKNLDSQVMAELEKGPATAFRIAQRQGVPVDNVRIVLKRLKSQGVIEWRGDAQSCRLKTGNATKDTSPFPRPWHAVPKVGWWG